MSLCAVFLNPVIYFWMFAFEHGTVRLLAPFTPLFIQPGTKRLLILRNDLNAVYLVNKETLEFPLFLETHLLKR